MGGRGASSGISKSGKIYGTEYHKLFEVGKIKFIAPNSSESNKVPLETMTKGRVYAFVNMNNELKSISFYDNKNKKNMTIDVQGKKHIINGKAVVPHLHIGYEHSENGTYLLSKGQTKIVDRVMWLWYNHNASKK